MGAPPCSNCRLANQECVLKDEDNRRGRPSSRCIALLQQRIRALERSNGECSGRSQVLAVSPPDSDQSSLVDPKPAQCQNYYTLHSPQSQTHFEAGTQVAGQTSDLPTPDSPEARVMWKNQSCGGLIIDRLLSNPGELIMDARVGQLRSLCMTGNLYVFDDSVTDVTDSEEKLSPSIAEDILSVHVKEHLLEAFWSYYNSTLRVIHKEAFLDDMENGRSKFFSGSLLYAILAIGFRLTRREHVWRLFKKSRTVEERPSTPTPTGNAPMFKRLPETPGKIWRSLKRQRVSRGQPSPRGQATHQSPAKSITNSILSTFRALRPIRLFQRQQQPSEREEFHFQRESDDDRPVSPSPARPLSTTDSILAARRSRRVVSSDSEYSTKHEITPRQEVVNAKRRGRHIQYHRDAQLRALRLQFSEGQDLRLNGSPEPPVEGKDYFWSDNAEFHPGALTVFKTSLKSLLWKSSPLLFDGQSLEKHINKITILHTKDAYHFSNFINYYFLHLLENGVDLPVFTRPFVRQVLHLVGYGVPGMDRGNRDDNVTEFFNNNFRHRLAPHIAERPPVSGVLGETRALQVIQAIQNLELHVRKQFVRHSEGRLLFRLLQHFAHVSDSVRQKAAKYIVAKGIGLEIDDVSGFVCGATANNIAYIQTDSSQIC